MSWNKKIHIVLGLIVISTLSLNVQAQDPQFSQVYAAPLYLNPALTGNTGQDRIAFTHRRQWMGLGDGYLNYAASYDHNFRKQRMGIGFSVLRDQAGIHGLQFMEYAGAVSKDINAGPMSGLRVGIKLAYTSRSFNRDKVLFWDQLYNGGGVSDSPSPLLFNNVNYFDSGAGILYYTSKFWGGINANHLNRPDQSFMNQQSRLPMKFTLHAGAVIPLKKPGKHFTQTTLKPVVIYKFQQDWDQLDVGGYIQDRNLRFGFWYRGLPIRKKGEPDYRNNDALVFMFGAEIAEQLQLGYSYDITISHLSVRSGGSHEISLIFEWPRQPKKHQPRAAVPCPRF
jgi:type IX secretion system PorP/SprF family membrane protein